MAARLPCDSLSNGSQWQSMMCPVNGVCRMTVPPAAGPTARPSARVPHDDPPVHYGRGDAGAPLHQPPARLGQVLRNAKRSPGRPAGPEN
jgi:hypothetical protein